MRNVRFHGVDLIDKEATEDVSVEWWRYSLRKKESGEAQIEGKVGGLQKGHINQPRPASTTVEARGEKMEREWTSEKPTSPARLPSVIGKAEAQPRAPQPPQFVTSHRGSTSHLVPQASGSQTGPAA